MTRAGEAGASSEAKYQELARSWRRRNRKLFAILALICGSVLVGSFFAERTWTAPSYFLGFVGGCAFCFFLVAWWSPPGWIENWQEGAWGEQATAKVLRQLEAEGWMILHDLLAGRGNVDHIAVGPGGVFLPDSKRLAGEVAVQDGHVMVTRFDDPGLFYTFNADPQLLRLARQTHDRVKAATRINLWVVPVLVIWSDFPQREFQGRCAYVHGEELVNWLRRRPQAIAPERVPQIADAVRIAWRALPAA